MDQDLRSIQQARDLIRAAREALHRYQTFTQEQVDRIVAAMAAAGEREAQRLGQMAHEETGFGRPESKTLKNLFATKVLHERMRGMKTCGIIRKLENDTIWEIATPMGLVAALIPSTNPTSTAMYKAIIAAKARCALVMSPHPRAVRCTAEALRVVAEAAYQAGAPPGLFGCMTEVSLPGTNALLEDPATDLILATGGTAMVRAAYSKGKPAYGVGSGNVPVYVDRSANLAKAAADIVYGASFDWGTLCSTERSVIADAPIRSKLIEAMKQQGAYFLSEAEKDALRGILLHKGRLNVEQVGKSPAYIARLAGFSVPEGTRALVAEVEKVGREEPLSMETLSPILAFYTEDGWQTGCARCVEVLNFGGMGHTLGLHATNERVIEAFALQKPAMRIVVNTVAALGSVGYTNRLFPAMTLGPGTLGGSITSDNISPMHLLNVKRLAFETDPINPAGGAGTSPVAHTPAGRSAAAPAGTSWIDAIEARLRARAGNPASAETAPPPRETPNPTPTPSPLPLPDEQIENLIQRFKK
ncbi:aldehyde dehydrogenase family protein [Rhodocaloribacter litoris]|uniref:aldehyde dehydrogenase family protein n=1 Tax=Rhodocaloribacter litoris TaxID=2558931 RepID=UPI001E5FCF0D|nr:aldehyde dehydrogenase family protein [Rhodocaloribacter litoris]QXD16451.1 aldehyde dehydrogenase family protein [Rhodocaloribacter litoris]